MGLRFNGRYCPIMRQVWRVNRKLGGGAVWLAYLCSAKLSPILCSDQRQPQLICLLLFFWKGILRSRCQTSRPMNPQFRLAFEKDLPAVNAFNPNQLPVWKHEFFSGLKPQSCLAICEDGSKVVGTEGYVEYRLLQNGQPILSHRSERTLVSPDYRGKNLFQGMIDLCTATTKAQGSLFCWGATAAQKAFERAGFHYHSGYRTYAILPLSNAKYVFKHLVRGKAIPLNPLKLYKQLKARDIKVSK